MQTVKELSRLYLEIDAVQDALNIFEAAVAADVSTVQSTLSTIDAPEADTDDEENFNEVETIVGHQSLGSVMKAPLRVGFEELNMLAELYIAVFEYEKAITAIKQGLRKIFPESNISHDSDTVELALDIPIHLKVKLGICRLHLNNSKTAQDSFNILYQFEPTTHAELFFDVAEAYSSQGKFETALNVFNFLTLSPAVILFQLDKRAGTLGKDGSCSLQAWPLQRSTRLL